MDENQQVRDDMPTCAGCCRPFSWDKAYHHQDTPGSAPYNPPGHGIFRPRAYCPNCGALVAEWHINQTRDYDEWAWYGENAALNGDKPLPPSPIYLWGKSIPVQFVPAFDKHRLVQGADGQAFSPPGPLDEAREPRAPAPALSVFRSGYVLPGVSAPVLGPAVGTTRLPAECAKCHGQTAGQDVRIYYGSKIPKSGQSYTDKKSGVVMKTTSYLIRGYDDVRICDRCAKKRSRLVGLANALWSVPLGLVSLAAIAGIVAQTISEGFQEYFGASRMTTCGAIVIFMFIIYRAAISVQQLVRPLNETSRSAVARKVVAKRHAGRSDAFWTEEERKKLL